jgi:protease IV
MKNKKIGILSVFVIFLVILIIGVTSILIISEVFAVVTEENNKIAEIKIDFPITDIKEEQTLFGPTPSPSSDDIIAQIRKANKREDIRAIVLYVNSPGGEVIASREIYEEVIKTEKPVVTYIRQIGASGAYYIASGSDYIIAEPESLTGSIGVMIGGIVSFEKMFENLGIDYNTISSGDKKNMGDIGRDMSLEEKEIIQEIVNQIFEDFKKAVYENRKDRDRFSNEKFQEVTDGRLMSGRTAYEIGLIDEIGNSKKAFEKAKELAGLEDYKIVRVDETESSRFFGKFAENIIKPINIGITIEHKIINENGIMSKINS